MEATRACENILDSTRTRNPVLLVGITKVKFSIQAM